MNDRDGLFVFQHKTCGSAGLVNGQGAVVVTVEDGQGAGIIGDEPDARIVDHLLLFQGAGQQINGALHLLQFGALFAQALLVEGVAFDEMLLQNPGRLLTELGPAL